MNHTELRTFLAIIETGSLVRASERLHVTQSTVTARLKALEDEVGQKLITRRKSGATLTAAGTRLQRYAAMITDLWQQAQQETALHGGARTICTLAVEPDLWPGLGQVLFDTIHRLHPDFAISISLGSEAEVAGWLTSGVADIALTYRAASHKDVRHSRLGTDRLKVYSTDPGGPIRFNPDYVYVDAGDEFSRQHMTHYADAGTARLGFSTARLALDHILAHGGSAYLPSRLVRASGTRALHILKEGPVFDRDIWLAVRDGTAQDWDWFDTTLGAARAQFAALD